MLYETIRRIVAEEIGKLRLGDLAVVQQIHPHAEASDYENYACTVKMRDSGLILKSVPVMTSRVGAASLPQVGDLVLVLYLGGDVNRPLLLGSFYDDQRRPPLNDENLSILRLPLSAQDADAVSVELESGAERRFRLRLGNFIDFSLSDDGGDPAVKLDVGGGKASVEIDQDGAIRLKGKNVFIEGDGIAITATRSALDIKADQADVNINGGPNVKIN